MQQYFLYVDRDTWLHRLDPRTKLLAVLGLFVLAVTFSDPRYLLIPTAAVLLLLAAGQSLRNLRKLWLLLVLLFVYCLVLWPFFVSGRTPMMEVAGRRLTWEAAGFGLAMGIRLNLMLLSGLLLLSTTTIEGFALGLQRLGLPAPVSVTLSLAFRWVPSLLGSASAIVQAQRARGLDLAGGGLVTRLRRYPAMLVPLVGHQLRQTRLLVMALESKGFGPAVPRNSLVQLRLHGLDWVALLLTAVGVGAGLWLRVLGYGVVEVGF